MVSIAYILPANYVGINEKCRKCVVTMKGSYVSTISLCSSVYMVLTCLLGRI